MKKLLLLFVILYVNLVYSQSPCGVGYSFNTYSHANCIYKFVPVVPPGVTIDSFYWRASVSGTACHDYIKTILSTDTAFYTFCFYGNHDVTMIVFINGGSPCYVTQTINVTCSGALFCNPDPGNDSIPDPVVEITYIKPDTCAVQGSPKPNCMSRWNGSQYNISCGWKWAIRIPPSSYNCEIFSYWLQYIDATSCDSVCTYLTLTPGVTYCIITKINESVYIVADGNHCCMPTGYQRGFIFTPTPSGSLSNITHPSTTYGICGANRCPTSGSCTENQQTMNLTSGWPGSHCFKGGGTKLEYRDQRILEDNANIEQGVTIYNTQGIAVFKGNWKFGNPNNLTLNWPNNLGIGLYLIEFENSKGRVAKLLKFY